MQCSSLRTALIALAAMLLTLGAARATDYFNNPNPAYRTMRDSRESFARGGVAVA